MTVDELTAILRGLGIGEEHRGYGQCTSEDLAQILLDHFDVEQKAYVTKTGKVLTYADIEELVAEAERGYNV